MRHLFALTFLLLAGLAHAGPIVVEDSRGPQRFETVPSRIAVLDWALAQQVLDLDIVPVAAPEIALYREWVSAPQLPEAVTDIGLRESPDLERLAALDLDVILAADLPEADVARLERIAPVMVFDAFDADHDNIRAAERIYVAIARLLDRERLARDRLDRMNRDIDRLAASLPGGSPRRAAVIRLNDPSTIWVYGENSFPQEAMHRLGLENALPQSPSRWGVAQRPLETLAGVENGAVLAIAPHGPGAAVFDSPLWSFLPAVAEGRFAEMPPLWSYGGILSLGRHAEAIHAALSKLSK